MCGKFAQHNWILSTTKQGVPRTIWNLDFQLRTLDFGLWTLDFELQTLDFGLRTMDYGLQLWSTKLLVLLAL